jgi:hypothetical protein
MRSGLDVVGNDISVNQLAVRAEAGLMIFASDHLGVRGDLRYFRGLQDFKIDDVDLGSIDFWRATVGVSVRF